MPKMSSRQFWRPNRSAQPVVCGIVCGRKGKKSFDDVSTSHSRNYDLSALSIEGDMDRMERVILGFDAIWKNMKNDAPAESLNILLYGAPGTGKSEFARYVARKLNRPLLAKPASSLINCYIGETEKNIHAAFREAEEKKAVLFFDEADSFLNDRSGAVRSYEVSQVNELLMQMENFHGIFIAATNFNDNLDSASMRRFALKVKFNYLKPEGIRKMWQIYFPEFALDENVLSETMLAPGDFNAVYGGIRYIEKSEFSSADIVKMLREETARKKPFGNRKMGF